MLYVDDLLISGHEEPEIVDFTNDLSKTFELISLGDLPQHSIYYC